MSSTKNDKRSSTLILLGLATFVVGAGLVLAVARGGGDGGTRQAAAAAPAVASGPAVRSAAGAQVAIPDGRHAVAVQLPWVAGAAGYVKPGARIHLYGTVKPAEDALPVTKLVLANVLVLDVKGGQPQAANDALTYLLALDPNEAERIVFLAANAQLWVGLAGDEQPVGPTPGRSAGDVL